MKFYIKTWGCQMNVYDSDKIATILTKAGYSSTDDEKIANVIVLNTCSIRENASEKLFSFLGRLKKTNPEAIIIVAGCVAQVEHKRITKNTVADIVVGTHMYHKIPELIANLKDEKIVDIEFKPYEKFDSLPVEQISTTMTGYVAIQEGCNHFCTYCIVPFTRGREYSRPVKDVIKEVEQLIRDGKKEIFLLGQNVNCYKAEDGDFADLLYAVADVPGVERLRYMTSYPSDMTDRAIEAHGKIPNLMPYMHLPAQSGGDEVLKSMNRQYTHDEYMEKINLVKKARPDIAITSDFIVGFPGETEEEFQKTVKLIGEVKYATCYSFKYSPRPVTPAMKMEQIPEKVKERRLAILQEEIKKYQIEFNESFIGKTVKVLVEKCEDGKINGRDEHYQSVFADSDDESLIGEIVEVKITEAFSNSLNGELISK
ncbi:MAG: tRNA (N6-isopentenyl adenosine(37)-C2)-methylthiotransferase MiaB [Alphaproteobacteria bacterium]|nr:tRNA (N6-isopentenyl adenosine(37)-C2)-methylthiotransferase MiaB [Alphaproteobacteria bacterium]